MTATHFDIAIVGGGMVGASFALALRDTPWRAVLIEGVAPDSAAQPSFDERTTALGNGTRRVFEALGVWQAMAPHAAAIKAIHVSDAGRYGFARLDAAEQRLDAFGYVVPNRVIGQALWAALAANEQLEVLMPARPVQVTATSADVKLTVAPHASDQRKLSCSLAVAADGAQSMLRKASGITAHVEDYDQVAVVVNVAADRPNDGTAYERFTPTGPLAVLPLPDGSYTVVWTLRPARASHVLQLPDEEFLAQLMQAFGWRAGRFTRLGHRGSYPLRLTRADETVATRTVLIGNSAQALHPVAGQGFNLGLRDAASLAEMLAQHTGDPGDPALLRRFAAWRTEDRRGVTRFTDGLVKLFADERPGFGVVRNLGLLLFDLSPAAKSALAKVSWGFAGRMPRLVRGLPLS
ncbi:MAG TPA: 2-octaprenyl-6-methoxyphenyl hydroxylase [Steroidobacteraceae bacterium]|nr:2-octaprenyl-6-methoxyphenyl hydroxylase [Steroidobacteraceae bacterium]HRX89276.1 2-octaprenyl-6-methoxyphenyl hydroxylase [Steroidobacteraceae bacterium]